MRRQIWILALAAVGVCNLSSMADDTFDKLIKARKFKEAIDYADESLPGSSRGADVWVAIAKANEELGLIEKAMACYLVSTRLNPKDYESWQGAARIYNKLGQHESAIDMARKALDLNFTGDASWEYAFACIKLNRTPEAKKALEKVIETDPGNIVANRELGNIYFTDKNYAGAIPLLKKAYAQKQDADVAYRIGKSSLETKNLPDAIDFLKQSLKIDPTQTQIGLELSRTFFGMGDWANASTQYDKALTANGVTSMDFYNNAVAKEKNGDVKGSLVAYDAAIRKFGTSTQSEALTSRLIVAKAQLDKKDFQNALVHFKFIAANDSRGVIAPEINYYLADCYEGLKLFDDAIASLEKAISLDSKNIEAYARLADLYKRANNEIKAKATYEKMIALSPNDPGVYLTLGQYNLKAKNYQVAYDQFAKSNSLKKSSQASEGLAIAAAQLGKWSDAKLAGQDALSFDAGLLEPRKIVAQALLKEGNFAGAIDHLEILVKREPKNLEYWKSLSLCYGKTNAIDKQADADKVVISLDKTDADSRARLSGYMLTVRKDVKVAYPILNELAELTPKNADVFKNLYTIALSLGDKPAALTRVGQYLALNPNDATAQRDLGDFLYEKKEYDGALVAYRKALALDPGLKGFYKRYAEIVIAKGQHDEAIKAINGKIKQGDASADDYTTLGTIYQKKLSFPLAIQALEKSLQLEPQNADVLAQLAECQASSGMTNEAIITYEQAIMMNQNASKELKSLGGLYAKQNKIDQAMKSYKRYLDKVPTDMAIAKQVGMYSYAQKKYDDAFKYLGMLKGEEGNDFDVQATIAKSYYNTKNWKDAIRVLEALLPRATAPGSARDLQRTLAECYENNGQNELAAKTYASYGAKAGVVDQEAAYKVAFLQEKTNQAAAIKAYEDNVAKYPRDFRNFLQLGLIYSDKKDQLSRSVSLLSRITTMADSIPSIWLKLAEVYGKLGRDDDELKAYKSYVRADPQNPEANKRIGLILLKKGTVKEGLINLEMAATLAPKDPDIQLGLAEAYAKTDRPNESIDALYKAKSGRANDITIIGNLAKQLVKVGRMKDAKAEVEALLKLNPNDNETRLMYARMLIDEKSFKEAQNELENVMASLPLASANFYLGKALTGQKNYKEAVKAFDEVININANPELGPESKSAKFSAPALYEKAELFRLYGKELEKSPKWAETFYERALRTDSTYALAELGLARLYKLWKKDDMYRKHLDRARKFEPQNSEVLDEYKNLK